MGQRTEIGVLANLGGRKVTTEEKLDRLVGIVDSLAASMVHHDDQIEAHDRQIEALIRVAEKHDAQIAALATQIANTERQWQAYINTLPRQ